MTSHQAFAQAIQGYDELNQKTAGLPAFRCNRRSYFARFSFIFLERPPVHPQFGVTGGLLTLKAFLSLHLPPDFLFSAMQAVNCNRSLATPAENHLFSMNKQNRWFYYLVFSGILFQKPPFSLCEEKRWSFSLSGTLFFSIGTTCFARCRKKGGDFLLESCFLAQKKPPFFSE